jgi:beta-lactamase regulating signal transducer with metallopeptidase domain/polyhydroxyalkanoate synthesis regulator phasin
MIDYILQMTLSNLLVALALAIVALVLQRRYRANALANVVWVMVLLKLLTPPLVSLPLVEVESLVDSAEANLPHSIAAETGVLTGVVISDAADLNLPSTISGEQGLADNGGIISSQAVVSLGVVWVGVTVLLLIVSLFRIIRFHIQIHRQAKSVEPWVRQLGIQIAATLGLQKMPRIVVLPANVSPFVWWLGGQPQIFLSQVAIDQLQPTELRMVLAHEMVHIRRFDHYVRWLEWFSAAVLWWNPVMWVARQQLRATEEIACDETVIRLAGIAKFDYANSLLKMAEILAKSTNRPPTVASEFNSGGDLEKRLKMIISNEQLGISQGVRMLTIVLAVCIFPVGLVYAQDYGAVQRRLIEAVKAGELSREQVAPMMEAMKRKPNLEEGEKATGRERYAAGAKRIEAAIKSGKISEVEGKNLLAEMRKQMSSARDKGDAKLNRADSDDMEQRKSRYMAGAKRIEAAIKSGKISEVEGKNRLAEMRKQMSPARDKGDAKLDRADSDDMEQRKSRYMAGAKRIEAAIKSGKISEVEGKNRLAEMRKQMSPVSDKGDAKSDRAEGGDMELRKRRYMAGAEEIEMAVEAGKMSKGDAERKLIEMRKKMFPSRSKGDAKSDRAEGGDMEVRKRRYMAGADEIEMAVEAGKMSKEDAEKTLIEMRKEMFPARGKGNAKTDRVEGGDMELRKRRYMAGAEEIEMAVEAGKMSKGDAERKLIEMRKEMFPARGKVDAKTDRVEGGDMELRKRRYMAGAEEIEMAVEAGKMSKGDAERKLIEMRKKMFPSRSKGDAKSDRAKGGDMEVRERRYNAAAKEIEASVESGVLSEKDAKEKLGEMRKKMFGK